jgi:hypothetical protein
MDATKSTISGVIENPPFIKGVSYTFSVNAKDSSGNSITTGGEIVYISITNPCTRGPNMACDAIPSAPTVLATDVNSRMTDHSNGTYTYTTTFNFLGEFTISFLIIDVLGTNGTLYDSNTIGSGTATSPPQS